jgi:hypothetical protein
MCSGHVVIQQTVSGGDNYIVFIAANNVDIICEMLQEKKQIAIELHKKYLQKKTDWLVNKEKGRLRSSFFCGMNGRLVILPSATV